MHIFGIIANKKKYDLILSLLPCVCLNHHNHWTSVTFGKGIPAKEMQEEIILLLYNRNNSLRPSKTASVGSTRSWTSTLSENLVKMSLFFIVSSVNTITLFFMPLPRRWPHPKGAVPV